METQAATISKLDEARDKDSKAVDEIRASQDKTAKSTADVLKQLNKLGSTNDEIKKFLGMSVPADLGRVLNNARTRNSSPDTVKGSLEGLSRP